MTNDDTRDRTPHQIEAIPDGAPFGEVRPLNLPSDLPAERIEAAVQVIEDWEASHRSACELIADLCPLLRA